MGLDSKQRPVTQKPIPPQGLQLAVCYSIINVGSHMESFNGQAPKLTNKVYFSWELPNLPPIVFDAAKGPQLMAVFQEYTVASGDKAKLPKMLRSWGNNDKISDIDAPLLRMFLGQACMINVEHKPSAKQVDSATGRPIIYANVGLKGLAVMPRMPEIVKPAGTQNPQQFFDLDKFDWNVYATLTPYMQEMIADSKEWAKIQIDFPKPAGTMAQALGYTQPAGYVAPQSTHVAADGKTYNAQGMLVQNQVAEVAAPMVMAQAGDKPMF